MSYQAEILWPHEEGSIEQLGYEFANAKTKEYQTVCWKMLLESAARLSVQRTAIAWGSLGLFVGFVMGMILAAE